jgi:uncharacterized protein (TIGR02246 family)
MKVRVSLIALVTLLALGATGYGKSTDSAAVADVVNGFVTAWNHHDATALANLYTSDADFVNVIGLWWHGRDEIRAQHQRLHEGRMKNTTLTSEAPVVRMVSPTVAIAHAKWELRGDVGAPGWKPSDVRRGIIVDVLVKHDGVWQIATTQNTDIVEIPNN